MPGEEGHGEVGPDGADNAADGDGDLTAGDGGDVRPVDVREVQETGSHHARAQAQQEVVGVEQMLQGEGVAAAGAVAVAHVHHVNAVAMSDFADASLRTGT